ncbi:hypothetical protein MKX01_027169 [Papaver californicum]|nr:hypothetical protein MKX01_027169 [Papaver californicum]
MNALEYFKTHLKYEKSHEIKEEISQKFTEYIKRAEEILNHKFRTGTHPIQDPQSFKEQAIDYVKRAVKEDNEMNYAKAFPLEAVQQKFSEYLRRAEELRVILEYGNHQVQNASPSTEELPQVSTDDSNTILSG